MATPDGRIIRISQEAIPENASATTGKLGAETPTTEAPTTKMPIEWKPGDPLPKAQQAQIDSAKFDHYSMDPNNAGNQGKWKAFEEIGYDLKNEASRQAGAQNVIDQLRQSLPNTSASPGKTTSHGPRFQVETPLQGPSGKSGTLVSVWQIDVGSDTPRLITNWLKVNR